LIAKQQRTGYVFCSLTCRASRDWGQLIGLSTDGLAGMNHEAIAFYREICEAFQQAVAVRCAAN